MKNKAISLARVSDVDQADNTSIEAQHDINHNVAESKGFEIIKEFSQVVSGGDDRKTVQEALEFCRKHNTKRRPQSEWVKLLIIQALARWFRDTDLSGYYRYSFRKLGVDVQAATEWTDKDKSGDIVMRSLREGMAEEERREGRRRSLRGVYYTWKNGYHQGQAPRGYTYLDKLDERGKRIFTQDPDLAPKYREAFTMIAAGVERMAVYNQLGGKEVFGSESTYYRAMKNEIYAGRKFYSSKVPGLPDLDVTLKVEPIIDFYTWQLAQGKQFEGKQGTVNYCEEDLYFARKSLKCWCGSSMTHESSKGRKERYHYYRCSKNHKHGRKRVERVHRFLERLMTSLQLSGPAQDYLQRKANEKVSELVKDVTRRIATLRTSLDRSEERRKKALVMHVDGQITGADYEVFKEASDKIKSAIARQEFLRDNQYQLIPQVLHLLSNIGDLYEKLNGIQQMALLNMLLPEGFYVESEKPNDEITICRTTRLNSIFSLTDSNILQFVYIVKGPTPLDVSPLQIPGNYVEISAPVTDVTLRTSSGDEIPVVYPEPNHNRTAEDFASFRAVYTNLYHLLPAA